MWDHVRGVLAWLVAHTTATGLAAMAAAFSALSSVLIMRVQRANLLESVRPELVLVGWYRLPKEHEPDRIGFRRVRNAGRGVALYVRLHAEPLGDPPLASMATMLLPLVEAGGETSVEGDIFVRFKKSAP
jgi:hypothetical protein